TPASGGNGTYSYQWQQSTTSSTTGFTPIASATGATYDAPVVTQTTYFRRVVSSSVCPDAISNTLTITVNPALTAGSIGTAQSFCASGDPAAFTETAAATGGNGSYTYQWQQSTTSASAGFTDISGATANVYDAPVISVTTYYRRVVSSSNCSPATSNVITVTVFPAIANNTISPDQTICTGTAPSTLVGSTPTGGNGTYTYQWESSTTGAAGFAAISGATGINYSPVTLTTTTLFRRRVTSGSCTNAVSNTLTVTVNAQPTVANAGPDQGPLNATFVTLAGNTPTVGTGTWTRVSGPNNPTIQNPNQSNTTVTGLVPGTYTFRWTIANAPCPVSTDDVDIRINVAPVANNDAITTLEDVAVNLSLLANDTDADGTLDAASVVIVTQPAHGTVTVSNGVARYTPAADYNGTDSFTYTVKDNLGTVSNIATATITITPVNDRPRAQNDRLNTDEDVPLNVPAPGVLANDVDPDGDVLTVSLVSGVSHGTLTLNSNGSFSYTPTLDYTGFDNFTYRVCDPSGACDTAVVTIEVGNINDAPVANNDSYTVAEDNTLTVAAPGVLRNDTDVDGDVLTVSLVTNVTRGTLTLNNSGGFVYVPNANYNGTDQFTYRACDGSGACATAVATITITPVNDKPVATNRSYTTDEDVTLTVPVNGVLAGVTDVDGDPLTASVFSGPSHGTLTLNANGSFTYIPAADYNGVDQFVYRACDNGSPSLCDTARVTITINPVNDAPVAVTDNYTVAEDNVLTVSAPGVLGNDTDKENDVLTATLVSGPLHGTLSLNANGRFVYTPVANYNGPDQFTYRACDPGNLCSNAVVNINVTAVNDAPTAGNDSYSVAEDNTLTVAAPGVLANDADVDGDPLTVTLLANVTHGTLTLNSNGSFVYVPAPDYNGTDGFTYRVCDPSGSCATGTVTLQVNAVNDKPVANDDSYTTNEDVVLTIAAPGLIANDFDADGDPLTAARITLPAHGTVTVNANGGFVYTPVANYNGTDQFNYRVCDGSASCDTATVFITINPVNDAPVAGPMTFAATEDITLNIPAPGVLANSSDVDGNPLSASLVSGPANGTIVLNSNGSFTYTPAPNYNGVDAFVINVCDPFGACDQTTITLNIAAVNDAPIAVNDTYTLNEDAVLTIANPGVLANDSDPDGDAMTVNVVTTTKHGSINLNAAGGFVYTPDADYNGTDSLVYRVCDIFSACNTATVYFTINAVNDAPRATADVFTIDEDNVLTRTAPGLLFNDFDPEGNAMTASLFTAPANGTAVVNADGSFTYTPNLNFNGTDVFVYRVCDNATPSLCATQNVTITVNPVNDKPVAVPNTYTTAEDNVLVIAAPGLLGNDSDPEGDPITASVYTQPLFGTVTINPNGSFLFTPSLDFNGTDRFVYQVCDNSGACDTAGVTITVTPVNDAPRPKDDNFSTAEDVPLVITAPGVLFNDSDPEGDGFSAFLVSGPLHGTATIDPSGSFVYTPAPNFVGIDSLVYRATDIFGASGTAIVRIVVTPVNDDPTAVTDNYTLAEDSPLTVPAPGVLGNDSDVDGDPIQVNSITTQPLHGTVSINPDGSFTYSPNTNYNGTDSFVYRVTDGQGGSANGTVNLTITPVNDNPTPQGVTYTVMEDTPYSLPAPGLMFNDTDPDGDPLTATLTTPPANGTAVVNPDGSFTYTPNPNFTGTDSFVYTVNDGNGGTATATATFIVTPVNDQPVAVDDNYSVNEDNTLTIPAPGILANDTDVDGDVLTVTAVPVQPFHGTFSFTPSGGFVYTPALNFNGTDNFTYIISDGNGGSDTALVTITVIPVNDPPVANNDEFSVTTNVTLTIPAPGVIFNDSEFDGETLSVVPIVAQVGPGGGTLTLNADGSLTYVPVTNLSYDDVFTYTLRDASGNTATATATFHVGQGNDDPIAANDSYTTAEDTPLNVAPRGVLINDVDPDDAVGTSSLAAILVSGTSNGQLTLNPNGSFSYVPNQDFFGTDSFTYNATDANGATDLATVTITVTSVNDAPVAGDNTVTGTEDVVLTIDITNNDSDVDGTLNLASVDLDPTTPAEDKTVTITGQGTYTVDNNAIVTFTPVLNFNGSATPIQYTIKDNNGALSNMATISIILTPVNDAPFANPDSYTIAEDGFLSIGVANGVLANDGDVDGDPIVSVLAGPANGTLVLSADGSFTYQPNPNFNGTDSFVYRACDASGACSPPVTVTFTVTAVNDDPVAVNDVLIIAEDTPGTGNVSLNDSDVDGDPLTYALIGSPISGTVSFAVTGVYTYTPGAFFNGSDQFAYRVCDNSGACDTGYVFITVTPVNNPPQAYDDIYYVNEDTELFIDEVEGALRNDIDPDGELIISTLVSTSNGTLVLQPTGAFRYLPNPNFFGTDSFVYQACDSAGACDTATVTLVIAPVNDAPVAVDDAFSIAEDYTITASYSATILVNDFDVDGDSLYVTPIGTFTKGTLVDNGNGTFSYTAAPNFNGTDSIQYQICDISGACDTAFVRLIILPVNDAPVVTGETFNVSEDTPLSINAPGLLANDTDVDGDPLVANLVTGPRHGTATITSSGALVYNPDPNYNGSDSLIYEVCDPSASCVQATVYFNVTAVNDAPTALADNYTIAEDGVLVQPAPGVLFNDFDVDGDPIAASVVTPPANGTLVLNPNGSFTYTPNPNFNGTDQFVYQVCDNGTPVACASQTVTLNVTAVNDAPVAVADVLTATEDQLLTILPPGLLANDYDADGDPLTSSVFTPPAHGTLVLNPDGSFTYTPAANYNGSDRFVYQVCDNSGACDTASVVINVTAVNDAPVAGTDMYTVNEDNQLVVPAPGILFNDIDVDGDALTAVLLSGPRHGTATISPAGGLVYTPAANFNGMDTIFYTVKDGNGGISTGTILITVVSVNDNPNGTSDAYSVLEDNIRTVAAPGVLGNDTDPDGDVLSVQGIVLQPAHGTVVIQTDGSFVYTPVANYFGTDLFIYRVIDGNGGADTVLVNFTVIPVNDAPNAVADNYTATEDTPLSIAAPGVLFNDIDVDGDVLSAVVSVQPLHGTLSLAPNGSFTYTPAADFNGTDSFTYLATDGFGGSTPAVVTITVLPVNDAPVGRDDSYTVAEDTPLTIAAPGVLANDTDVDGDVLTLGTVTTQPLHGVLTTNANGSFTYVANPNYFGPDNFVYIVLDGKGGSSSATVNINVSPVNDPPVARDDLFIVQTSTTLVIGAPGVLFNDMEYDGENFTAVSTAPITGANGGMLTLSPNGSFTYVPAPGLSYTETFPYTIVDASGSSASAIITFIVGPGNDVPVAANDTFTTTEDVTLTIAAPGVLANDTDADDPAGQNNLAAILVSGPSLGTLLLNADGSFTYVPNHDANGTDTFTYNATDANGATSLAAVTINITPVNDAPVANDDAATTDEDVAVMFSITSNDTDVEGPVNGATVDLNPSTPAEDKTLSVAGQGVYTADAAGMVTFTPAANYHGTTTPVAYTVKDAGGLLSNIAYITVTVNEVNDAPVAGDDNYTVIEDNTLLVNAANGVLANDSDPDGEAIVSILSTTANGTLLLNMDGSFEYHPNLNFNGIDSFTYQACDLGGACSTPATVTITVTPVNDAPVAVNDTVTTAQNVAVSGHASTNDLDPEGGALTYTVSVAPANGSVVLNTNGTFTYNPALNFNGSDHFTYSVCDNGGLCATAVVVINVTAVNQPPVANPDTYTISENQQLSRTAVGGLLANDNDPDGPVQASLVSGPANGTLTLNPDGSFLYIPNTGFNGTDNFIYRACDASGACDTALVTINITPVNDVPVARNDFFTIVEDGMFTYNPQVALVNPNDTDADGDPLTLTFIGGPANGINFNNGNGTYTYRPNPNFNGTDSIPYRVCDPSGACDTAYAIFTIQPVNDAPVAVDDSYFTLENQDLTVVAPGVLGNDSDVDGDIIVSALVTTTNGTLALNSNGSFTYAPNPGFAGTDSFTYSACDIFGACDTATVTIDVLPVNHAPIAVSDSVFTFNDVPVSGRALDNDSDPDGDLITASLISGPANGTLVFNNDGTFTYTPNTSFIGTDLFFYSLCDNGTPSLCDTGAVFIQVNFTTINQPPVAVNDTYTTTSGVTLTVAAPGVIANDSDADKALLVATVVSGTTNGTLVLNANGSFTYTPAPGFVGADSFIYSICDTSGLCDTATVFINVLGANRAPIAVNDVYTTAEDQTLNVAVPGFLSNDSEPDGDPLSISLLNFPGQGTLILVGKGGFRYIPNPGYTGQDSFQYRICDNRTPQLCSQATVVINVNPRNDQPRAMRDEYMVSKNSTIVIGAPGVQFNDNDPDGDVLNTSIVTNALHGTMVLQSNGAFTYTPNTNFVGKDSALYKLCDPTGLCDQAYAVFIVSENVTNQPPVALNDTIYVAEDQVLTFTRTTLLANDSDPDGDALQFTRLTTTTNGTLTESGINFTYTPAANFNGTDRFNYRICDPFALCDDAMVVIVVTPVNDKPLAQDDHYQTNKNTALNQAAPGVLVNDSDIDGGPLAASLITNPSNGTMTVNANGSFTYTPNSNFVGVDSCLYRACDGLICDTAMIRITVLETDTAVNRPPVAVNDTYATPVNTTLTQGAPGVLLNDSDPDGNALSAALLIQPAHGTVILNSSGSFSYIPETNYIGTDQFTYNACDGGGLCDSATVFITITPLQGRIGVAKTATITPSNGGYLVNFSIVIRNYGNSAVSNVRLTDNLVPVFPFPVTYSVVQAPASNGALQGNPAYNGAGDVELLTGTGTLAPGQSETVTFAVQLTLSGTNSTFSNTALGYASLPGGTQLADRSQNGTNPDPDGDGNPNNNSEPTPMVIYQAGRIGLAKAVSAPKRELDGSYTVTYTLVVKNFGPVPLQNVQVNDLLTETFPGPATFVVRGNIRATGELRANQSFDGRTSAQLLQTTSTLSTGRTDTVQFTVNVVPNQDGDVTYENNAEAVATVFGAEVRDLSVNGLNPDTDGNGAPDESGPTPVTFTANTIYIPGGFSPDGDGVNDVFVLRNYGNQTIDLEMFNRWGNVVYKNPDYNNDWNGTCNTGIYLGDDLPDGTYYYVIKLSGGDSYVGFITINR
ncbi:MAG: Ig-like domain-containing protein, partial [Bacteroidota bacterium]